MNRLAKDIISSEVFLLLFLFSSGFVSFIYLFFGKIRAKEFYSLSEKKLTWESRVLRKKHLSREGEKSGCSRLGQQSYFDFNYTPEARLTSARGREKGRVKKKGREKETILQRHQTTRAHPPLPDHHRVIPFPRPHLSLSFFPLVIFLF